MKRTRKTDQMDFKASLTAFIV